MFGILKQSHLMRVSRLRPLGVSEDYVASLRVGDEENEREFSIKVVVVGVVAQMIMYVMYTQDEAFFSGAYTTAMVQTVLAALLMILVYFPLFYCPGSKLNTMSKIGSVITVSGFMITTGFGLPIPVITIIISGLALSNADVRGNGCSFFGNFSGRIILTLMISVGTILIVMDTITHTKAGYEIWNTAKSTTTIRIMYVMSATIFFVGVWVVNTARKMSMHTANVLTYGFTRGMVIVIVFWAMSFISEKNRIGTSMIGGFNNMNPNGTRLTVDEAFAHIGIVLFNTVLKLIALACIIESIKFGKLFLYSACSSIPYFIFVAMISNESSTNSVPATSIIGIVFVASSLLIIVATHRRFRNQFDDETNLVCHCAAKTTLFNTIWHPKYWCDQTLRKQLVDENGAQEIMFETVNAREDEPRDDDNEQPPLQTKRGRQAGVPLDLSGITS